MDIQGVFTIAVTTSFLCITSDPTWLAAIRAGYDNDTWCRKIREHHITSVREKHGLLYMGNRLVIPWVKDVREHLFRLVHDALGHFGAEKSYASLRSSYYWPNMRKEMEGMYVPSCEDCQ